MPYMDPMGVGTYTVRPHGNPSYGPWGWVLGGGTGYLRTAVGSVAYAAPEVWAPFPKGTFR